MNRKANGMVIGILVALIVLGAGGYLAMQMMKPAPMTNVAPTPSVNLGDIDRSGAADEGDRVMIRGQFGCVKDQPCWNTTVGKTKDGDNPLYTFDLDLDKDGAITPKDALLVK